MITPRFPDGLTVELARGQYRDRFGVIEHERSYLVTLLYPTPQAKPAGAAVEEIRRSYDQRFQQEAVGRVDGAVKASFQPGPGPRASRGGSRVRSGRRKGCRAWKEATSCSVRRAGGHVSPGSR
ncbi:DUF3574 domain-containing protein [Kitasatospora aureofaciens]|uniref:DUF3574 domain-containing protein n=1 Tax=Kitasatospora aureofaciens TaxID=1894 RepID=UPI0007C4AE8C